MRLELQKGERASDIEWSPYEVAFCGDVVDDRGEAAIAKIGSEAANIIKLRYEPSTLKIDINGAQILADDFASAFSRVVSGDVVLEATTLGFVELLLCCRALRANGAPSFDIVYVEPDSYRSPRRGHLLHRRDFELSEDVPGYQAIPGHAILLSDRTPQKCVFFLGYEEARLRRAFEDLQMLQPAECSVAFGVPAFKPGWEIDAIANNIDVIREQGILGGTHFCGAENPIGALEILSEVHRSLDSGQRLFVAPIGTKPHGIGVALFVSQHTDVRVIYDHPQRKRGRSDAISHWHLFSVREYQIHN